jgi:prepilin-type N-terminal cleavage/methylation domain-containing protein
MKIKKKTKGFTLVECIVAIAILGIAAMVMLELYTAVCSANVKNHRVNESLSQTIAEAEKQNANGDASKVLNINTGSNAQVTFKCNNGHEYKNIKISLYVCYSTDSAAHSNTVYDDKSTDDPLGVTYKYFDVRT